MIIRAYAKINIALDVVGKREDGYHLLRMIMQQIDLYDEISIDKIEEGIELVCDKKYIPVDSRNLAYKAAELFKQTYSVDGGVAISINKNIPVAAGLAGGSADAAAVLIGMNKLFGLNRSIKELMELSVSLGADIPYCINGGTALCEGIGEEITSLKAFKNHILVLAKPNFGVSTKEVYKALDVSKINRHPNIDKIIKAMGEEDLSSVCFNMRNLLENVTLKKHQGLRRLKNQFIEAGALGSMMSGSGPTVFGFFDNMLTAQRCYDKLKKAYKEVFITRTI